MTDTKKPKEEGTPISDVTKPGKSAPSSTSKPIIVTNRPVLKDPMVLDETSPDSVPGESLPTETTNAPTMSNRVKIEPLHDNLGETEESKPETEADSKGEEPKTDDSGKSAESKPSTETQNQEDAPPKKKSAEEDEATLKKEAERAAELQKLIDSRKYYLPINQVEKRRTKRSLVIGALFIILLGLAWADVALDAGIITIPGVKAPTHFFK